MIINNEREQFITGGKTSVDRAEYRLSGNSKLFEILSKSIYSNKVRAIVRELSTNAWEGTKALVSASNGELPFTPPIITLPTRLDPNFKIRDFGISMSHELIKETFAVYGESTKSHTSDDVGGFGIGAKSPFSYTNIFHIKAFKNGVVRIYENSIQESGTPVLDLKLEKDTDEPDGIEISFSVDAVDVENFKRETKRVLSGFSKDIRPEVKGDIGDVYEMESYGDDALPELHLISSDVIGRHDLIVRMGCVFYPVRDHEAIIEAIDTSPYMNHMNKDYGFCYVLDLPIDTVSVRPTREDLDYDSKTVEFLLGYIEKMNQQFRRNVLRDVWDMRNNEDLAEVKAHFFHNYTTGAATWITGISGLYTRPENFPTIRFKIKQPDGKVRWYRSVQAVESDIVTRMKATQHAKFMMSAVGVGTKNIPECNGTTIHVTSGKITFYEYEKGCLGALKERGNGFQRNGSYYYYVLRNDRDGVQKIKSFDRDSDNEMTNISYVTLDAQKARAELTEVFGNMVEFETFPEDFCKSRRTQRTSTAGDGYVLHWAHSTGERSRSQAYFMRFTDLDELFDNMTRENNKNHVVYCAPNTTYPCFIDQLTNVVSLQKRLLKKAEDDKRFITVFEFLKMTAQRAKVDLVAFSELSFMKIRSGSCYARTRYGVDEEDADILRNPIVSRIMPEYDERLFSEFTDVVVPSENDKIVRELLSMIDGHFGRMNNRSYWEIPEYKFAAKRANEFREVLRERDMEARRLVKTAKKRLEYLKKLRPLLSIVDIDETLAMSKTVNNELMSYVFKNYEAEEIHT